MPTATRTYPNVARAVDYAEGVIAGTLPACRWVRLACERHIADLERWKGTHAPFFIAQKNGYFGKEGVTIDAIDAGKGATNVAVSVASGRVTVMTSDVRKCRKIISTQSVAVRMASSKVVETVRTAPSINAVRS